MDLVAKLADQGYLTAAGFVQYLKECHPILQISYPTLMRHIGAGKIKAIQVGGQTRISKDEIERYVQSGEGGDEPPSSDSRPSAVLRLGETSRG